MSVSDCPFCLQVACGALLAENESASAFFDRYPLAPGHALVVPNTHVAGLFDLDARSRAQVWALVDDVVASLGSTFAPDGFNVGVNVGAAAGQTVGHAHVHVVPRRHGDVDDPRGGVRWVIPERAVYWSDAAPGE